MSERLSKSGKGLNKIAAKRLGGVANIGGLCPLGPKNTPFLT